MLSRLLLALDSFEAGEVALDYTAGLAGALGSVVRVIHVRDVPRSVRMPPLETPEDVIELVGDAVLQLRQRGVDADGVARSCFSDNVARRIVEESIAWNADAIVAGSRRLRGFGRLNAEGLRDRIQRLSSLPMLIAPNSFQLPRGRVDLSRLAGST